MRKRPYRILYFYVFIWGIWFLFSIFIPVTSILGGWFYGGMASILYILSSVLSAFAVADVLLATSKYKNDLKRFDINKIRKIMYVSTGIGLMAVICIVYDRLFVQKINMAAGIAVARNLWLNEGEVREGASSIFSVVGNIFWGMSYVSLCLNFLNWEKFSRNTASVCLVVSSFTILAFAVLNGGRMPIFVAFALIMATLIVRSSVGMRSFPTLPRGAKKYILCALLLVLCYFPYVISQRAEANHLDLEKYALITLEHLQGKPTALFAEIKLLPESTGGAIYLIIIMIAYLVHPFWVFEKVLTECHQEGFFFFSTPIYLLQKCGLFTDASIDWTYRGIYLSMAGGAYHDTGIIGMTIIGLLHGFIIGISIYMLARRGISGLSLSFVMATYTTTVISPVIPCFLTGPFPTLIISFLIALPFSCEVVYSSRMSEK